MKVEDSSTIWENNWRLNVHTIRLDSGRVLQQATIEHPGAVVLVPMRQSPDGPEILMLRQYRLAVTQTILELPAGTRGWDEPWLACAQRELREETGYGATEILPLGEIWPAPGISDERMILYLAQGLYSDPLPGDEDEQIEVRPMQLQLLVEMALDGRLRDAKSIVGILRAARFLEQTAA